MDARSAANRAARVKDVKLIAEFRAFIMRGNVIDLAVGIIIGVAFGAVVTSMVNDVIMPPVGLAVGGVDFKESYVLLKDGNPPGPYGNLSAASAAGAVTVRYGVFINTLVNFLIVAAAVFLLVKMVGKMRAKEEAKEAATPTEQPCPFCLMKVPLGAKRCGHCTATLA
jgi:large conductance mechanosensitive channel